jgi:hypothetical protein
VNPFRQLHLYNLFRTSCSYLSMTMILAEAQQMDAWTGGRASVTMIFIAIANSVVLITDPCGTPFS